jgi:hypothetical protein
MIAKKLTEKSQVEPRAFETDGDIEILAEQFADSARKSKA